MWSAPVCRACDNHSRRFVNVIPFLGVKHLHCFVLTLLGRHPVSCVPADCSHELAVFVYGLSCVAVRADHMNPVLRSYVHGSLFSTAWMCRGLSPSISRQCRDSTGLSPIVFTKNSWRFGQTSK